MAPFLVLVVLCHKLDEIEYLIPFRGEKLLSQKLKVIGSIVAESVEGQLEKSVPK
jgi:hypothetical protein